MSELEGLDGTCLDQCLVGQALDGMCVGLVVMNPAGRVAWMNRAAEGLLGVDREASLGERLTRVIRDPQLAEFWLRAKPHPGNTLGEVTIRWPHPAELKVNATNCANPDGDQVARVLLFCDVTNERTLQVQLSQEAVEKLMVLAGGSRGPGEPVAGLTGRELEVLRMVGKGFGNAEIATQLRIAGSTVRTHMKQIYRKTGMDSRAEAISYAIQNGLT